MKKVFENPEFQKGAFTCPNCSAFSKHDWNFSYVNEKQGDFYGSGFNIQIKPHIKELYLCKCENCGYISFWYDKKLIWPLNTGVEAPIEEIPDDIKELYDEARSIVELSPKGACAILRLALQKLCNRLINQNENGDINEAIKLLVEQGLPKSLQQSFDIVRIVGNESVHPGTIDIADNKKIAITMFRLMNIIVERMIVEPKEIDDLYKLMPEEKLKGIENRDKKERK